MNAKQLKAEARAKAVADKLASSLPPEALTNGSNTGASAGKSQQDLMEIAAIQQGAIEGVVVTPLSVRADEEVAVLKDKFITRCNHWALVIRENAHDLELLETYPKLVQTKWRKAQGFSKEPVTKWELKSDRDNFKSFCSNDISPMNAIFKPICDALVTPAAAILMLEGAGTLPEKVKDFRQLAKPIEAVVVSPKGPDENTDEEAALVDTVRIEAEAASLAKGNTPEQAKATGAAAAKLAQGEITKPEPEAEKKPVEKSASSAENESPKKIKHTDLIEAIANLGKVDDLISVLYCVAVQFRTRAAMEHPIPSENLGVDIEEAIASFDKSCAHEDAAAPQRTAVA